MADGAVKNPQITSRLVTVADGRQVHVRVAGSGRPVLMLHESPRSSASMIGMLRHLVDRFTLIALDTPGYGWSDALAAEQPDITDYAHALPVLLDALSLEKVLVYAVHTGALIGVEAARLFPERFSLIVADGYPVFTPDERVAHLKSYLPPFRPSADGTHATWLWSRVRDQFTVFPWHSNANEDRLEFGPPPATALHRIACDFLATGDGYRTGYEAAFRHEPFEPLKSLRVPTALCFRPNDILDTHRARLKHMSSSTKVHSLSSDRGMAAAQIEDLLGAHAGKCETTDSDTLLSALPERHQARRLASSGDTTIEWATQGDSHGPSMVIVPDWPFHDEPLQSLVRMLAQRFKVHVLMIRQWPPDAGADAVRQAIAKQTNGTALAAFFGASAALSGASAAERTVLCDPWTATDTTPHDELPDLQPVWNGSHITRAFSMARDIALYRPFWQPQNNRMRDLAHANPVSLHACFAAIAQGGPSAISFLSGMLSEPHRWAAGAQVVIDDTEPDAGEQAAAIRAKGLAVHIAGPETGSVTATIADLADMAAAA